MFPYMHQDPTSFFANSAYSQPVMLIPPQTEYRNPPALTASAYRAVAPAPTYAASPSPYAPSPAVVRPYDLGKDWTGASLASLSVNDGTRSNKPVGTAGAAPFGGMFGTIPGFEAMPNTSISAQQGSAPVNQSLSSSAVGSGLGSTSSVSSGIPYKGFNNTNTSGYTRSGSVDGGEKVPGPGANTISRPTDGATSRPAAQHSRSSSLLYASKNPGSPTA